MDKKKKNGESFSFMNLAEYFNAEELEVESSLIKVFPEERQLEIWQMSARAQPKHGLRVYVGTYFELVATAIYGGIHHQRFTLGCELDNEPDSTLVRKKRIIHRESKAVAPKGYMRISDEQMAKYCLTQMGKGKYKNPRIIVDIFRYGIDKLESNFLKDVFKREGMGGLVGKLAETTQYLVSMPFGIIEHAYWHQIPRVVSRYKGKINEEDERRLAEAYKSGELSSYRARAYKHQPCTKIASGALDSLIKEPEAQIERFGLKAKDYLALKFKFPRGVRIDGHEIEPFPILIIRDRNYKSWLDNFKARMEKALEENKDNLEPAPMLAFMYDVMGRSEKRRQDEKMKRAKAEVLFRDYEQHFQEPPLEEQVAKVEEVGHFFDAMAKQEAEKEKG